MADETEEKTKKTVPGMVRSAKGVAEHAQSVQDAQWDKEKRTFKDPFTVTLALFTYAKLTATLLAEGEERLAKKQEAFEKRVAEFETRLTTMERWKAEAEAQTAEMAKAAEEMMASGKMPQIIVEQLQALAQTSSPELAAQVIDTTVTPLPKPSAKKDEKAGGEKNGGAA